MSEKKVFFCMCECSVIAVDTEPFPAMPGQEREIGFSVYRWGHGEYSARWRSKIRHIRYILKYGHPFSDDMLLTATDARELGELLISIADKISLGARNETR